MAVAYFVSSPSDRENDFGRFPLQMHQKILDQTMLVLCREKKIAYNYPLPAFPCTRITVKKRIDLK